MTKTIALRCHTCKKVKLVPKDTNILDRIACDFCGDSHMMMFWINLTESELGYVFQECD